MITWILSFLFQSQDTIFWFSAIAGTTLFVLRMAVTLLGGMFTVEDVDLDDFEHHDIDEHSASSFKLFTLHSFSGFLMMFGWIGLASVHQWHATPLFALFIASFSGFCVMILTALLMKWMLYAESSGTVFTIQKTKGLTGSVYQRIPEVGQGKIHIVVEGVTREILAQAEDGVSIESFALVKVVRIVDHEIVEVIALRKDHQ